jgi:MFS family permease
MALTAALLGWMFDGLEMGLFPLVARPALGELLTLNDDREIGRWFAVATAGFLVGAATGGVLFGWLGDRIGRVRAMIVSVLTYAVFSGLCALAGDPRQIAVLRFLSALGMGGEWSLGVALVMEIWPDRARGLLAGMIGAIGNVGYLLIGLLGLGLGVVLQHVPHWLGAFGVPDRWIDVLVDHHGWRLLMLLGAAPAFLTLFIQLFVPESKRWLETKGRGATSHWATRDLLGVLVGAAAAGFMIYLWAPTRDSESLPQVVGQFLARNLKFIELAPDDATLGIQVAGSALALVVATLGYLYPVIRYLQRGAAAAAMAATTQPTRDPLHPIRRMLLGALLGGVPLLVTWAAVQWATLWADQLTQGKVLEAKAYTQIAGSCGAIIGTMAGALLGDLLGRRLTYTILCLTSLGSTYCLFNWNHEFGTWFLVSMFFAGLTSASFYGWLPLYLPELFRTGMRATGQGFSFNFGRILAAVGVLQAGNLMQLFGGDYPRAGWIMSLVYLVGVLVIWLAPETRGKPLPE